MATTLFDLTLKQRLSGLYAIMWATRNYLVANGKMVALPRSTREDLLNVEYNYAERYKNTNFDNEKKAESILNRLRRLTVNSFEGVGQNLHRFYRKENWMEEFAWLLDEPFFVDLVMSIEVKRQELSISFNYDSNAALDSLVEGSFTAAQVAISLIVLERMIPREYEFHAERVALQISGTYLHKLGELLSHISLISSSATPEPVSPKVGEIFEVKAGDSKLIQLSLSTLKQFGLGMAEGCPAGMRTPQIVREWFTEQQNLGKFPTDMVLPQNTIISFIQELRGPINHILDEFAELGIPPEQLAEIDKILFPQYFPEYQLGPIMAIDGETHVNELSCPFNSKMK